MKKLFLVMLAIASISCSLSGDVTINQDSPKGVVSSFLKATKAQDYESMMMCVDAAYLYPPTSDLNKSLYALMNTQVMGVFNEEVSGVKIKSFDISSFDILYDSFAEVVVDWKVEQFSMLWSQRILFRCVKDSDKWYVKLDGLTTSPYDDTYPMYSKEGVGGLKFGTKLSDLPESMKGIYDSIDIVEEYDVMDDVNYNIYTFKKGDKSMFTYNIEVGNDISDKVISWVNVKSPTIDTRIGLSVGDDASKLIGVKGLRYVAEFYTFFLGEYAITINGLSNSFQSASFGLPKDEKGVSDVVLQASDLNRKAKIKSISIASSYYTE